MICAETSPDRKGAEEITSLSRHFLLCHNGHELDRSLCSISLSQSAPAYPQTPTNNQLADFRPLFTMRLPLKRALEVFCRHVIQTALRMLVTFIVFVACSVITLRYFGIPLPSLHEVLHSFDGVSELARILS